MQGAVAVPNPYHAALSAGGPLPQGALVPIQGSHYLPSPSASAPYYPGSPGYSAPYAEAVSPMSVEWRGASPASPGGLVGGAPGGLPIAFPPPQPTLCGLRCDCYTACVLIVATAAICIAFVAWGYGASLQTKLTVLEASVAQLMASPVPTPLQAAVVGGGL